MTTLLLNALAAVGLLIVAAVLLRRSTRGPHTPLGHESEHFRDPLNASSLALAERIFDPGDYLWLRSEVGFPYLAEDLWHTRRRLALDWLRAVRRSFDELARTPEPLAAPHPSTSTSLPSTSLREAEQGRSLSAPSDQSRGRTGPAGRPTEDASSSWPLLWLTLRFHALMGYALFVVYTFGPYTRLVPSLGWMHTYSEFVAPGDNSRMAPMRNAL